jgi:hypothetical protein
MLNTLFAIDLDDTIAGDPNRHKLYIAHHNEDLELGIAPEILDNLPDYKSFLRLPQVKAYRRVRFIFLHSSTIVSVTDLAHPNLSAHNKLIIAKK